MAGSNKTGIAERKRAAEGAVSGRRKRSGEDCATVEDVVSEEEVEEFFAILRRINVAVKHFKVACKDNGRRKVIAILEAEVQEVVNAGVQGEERRKRKEEAGRHGTEENAGFDLNLDPDPEIDPI